NQQKEKILFRPMRIADPEQQARYNAILQQQVTYVLHHLDPNFSNQTRIMRWVRSAVDALEQKLLQANWFDLLFAGGIREQYLHHLGPIKEELRPYIFVANDGRVLQIYDERLLVIKVQRFISNVPLDAVYNPYKEELQQLKAVAAVNIHTTQLFFTEEMATQLTVLNQKSRAVANALVVNDKLQRLQQEEKGYDQSYQLILEELSIQQNQAQRSDRLLYPPLAVVKRQLEELERRRDEKIDQLVACQENSGARITACEDKVMALSAFVNQFKIACNKHLPEDQQYPVVSQRLDVSELIEFANSIHSTSAGNKL
ncbi:MAG: hypothetical protein KDH94_06635, partial [Coxiellaceae bacterium]|nr:hypothetical protein [Coxiellaceae bacterium]